MTKEMLAAYWKRIARERRELAQVNTHHPDLAAYLTTVASCLDQCAAELEEVLGNLGTIGVRPSDTSTEAEAGGTGAASE